MAVESARRQIAKVAGVKPSQVIWTSGATESNNMAIFGWLEKLKEQSPGEPIHFITGQTEHKAVLEVMCACRKRGAEVSILQPNSEGVIEPDQLRKELRPHTRMVSLMAANNEIGALHPIADIAAICHEHGIVFHCDAAQAFAKLPIDLSVIPIDLLSISSHKVYGPKGAGALIFRPINREFELATFMIGGEQERRRRPGTLNVPGIVGLGKASEICAAEREEECARLTAWQNRIIESVLEHRPEALLNGPKQNRLFNNISFCFRGLTPDKIAEGLSGLAYSAGSACTSGNPQPSHVLKAIGRSDPDARSAVRLGLGRFTTADDIDLLIDKLVSLPCRN